MDKPQEDSRLLTPEDVRQIAKEVMDEEFKRLREHSGDLLTAMRKQTIDLLKESAQS